MSKQYLIYAIGSTTGQRTPMLTTVNDDGSVTMVEAGPTEWPPLAASTWGLEDNPERIAWLSRHGSRANVTDSEIRALATMAVQFAPAGR